MESLVDPFEIYMTMVYIQKAAVIEIIRENLSSPIEAQMGVTVMCLWNELCMLSFVNL